MTVRLADRLYTVAQVREIDRRAIAGLKGDGFALMTRAAEAAWRRLRTRWSESKRIVVCAGAGNNGGDGYVLGRLALASGIDARVVRATAGEGSTDDACRARAEFLAAGGAEQVFDAAFAFDRADLLIDAVFGIGLSRAPAGPEAALIERMLAADLPIMALDLPSGLDADSGHAHRTCVRADLTVTFIAHKRGLVTGDAPDRVGELVLEDLGLDVDALFSEQADAALTGREAIVDALPRRARTAHKGSFGHVLLIGGDHGMAGAVLLAAAAAARSGAGLVSVATRAAHAQTLVGARPELMVRGVESEAELNVLLKRATVLAIGPGLGQGEWGRTLLHAALRANLPGVFDADALNLVAAAPQELPSGTVLTPHPGEAARLMGVASAAALPDRYTTARTLAARYRAVVVLKGAGTLIAEPGGDCRVCASANPGMATGGMGDVLAGVIAALMAQGLAAFDAASVGVAVHAEAARRAALNGERGMLAMDVVDALRATVNP